MNINKISYNNIHKENFCVLEEFTMTNSSESEKNDSFLVKIQRVFIKAISKLKKILIIFSQNKNNHNKSRNINKTECELNVIPLESKSVTHYATWPILFQPTAGEIVWSNAPNEWGALAATPGRIDKTEHELISISQKREVTSLFYVDGHSKENLFAIFRKSSEIGSLGSNTRSTKAEKMMRNVTTWIEDKGKRISKRELKTSLEDNIGKLTSQTKLAMQRLTSNLFGKD